jgi:SAM-dependent methyltransferase
MYSTAADARNCQKGDIRLVEDLETGLVYNAAFRPELMIYDERYQNEQAFSPLFRVHLEEVAGIVESTFGHFRIVEIGCGKAYFLEMLLAKGFDVIGFDPAYEGRNPRVIKKYFEKSDGIQAGGIVLRHVLEHVPDPVAFLHSLKDANRGEGMVYIEVPNFDWICEHNAWFDIFYEHVNYFRISDFRRIFGKINRYGNLFGDQYLFVVADLASLRVPKFDPSDRVNTLIDFTLHFNNQEQGVSAGSVIWGGASKGVIFSLLRERYNAPISVVIDVNPDKQGLYIPGTGLRVQSPPEALPRLPIGATIYVMNSNYLPEIKKMSNNAYRYVSVDHD